MLSSVIGIILILFSEANLNAPFLKFLRKIFLGGIPPSGKIQILIFFGVFLLALRNALYPSFYFFLFTITELCFKK